MYEFFARIVLCIQKYIASNDLWLHAVNFSTPVSSGIEFTVLFIYHIAITPQKLTV